MIIFSPGIALTGGLWCIPMTNWVEKNLRINYLVNILDGSFFGAALGFASFITVIPLFVSQFTDSAVLIGLIPAIHAVGWQLPQLFTASWVSGLKRFKPSVIFMTSQERIPFLVLAIIAWFSPKLPTQTVLVLIFLTLIWQGLGGGFTATGWQSMIAKIIPSRVLGTFYGMQSASASLLASGTAILAGLILEVYVSPLNFTACFLLASFMMLISWIFLSLAREEKSDPFVPSNETERFSTNVIRIMKKDINFRWFVIVRMWSQFAIMGFAFYTVYVEKEFNTSTAILGLMTGLLLIVQVTANPLMGWLGDRRGHKIVLEIGILASFLSGLLAFLASSFRWFYLVYGFAGIANVAAWTIPIAMIMDFSGETERPAYIGLANTLIAPFTFLAPLLGGWIANLLGYQYTFILSALAGIITLLIIHFGINEPRKQLKFADPQ
jgi:MFS family permease